MFLTIINHNYNLVTYRIRKFCFAKIKKGNITTSFFFIKQYNYTYSKRSLKILESINVMKIYCFLYHTSSHNIITTHTTPLATYSYEKICL